jgi:tRNA splicing endonuclease
MTWLLMVIILNIQISPPEVKESHIMEMFDGQKECIERHEQFYKDLKDQGIKVPDDFNLGCVPLTMVRI